MAPLFSIISECPVSTGKQPFGKAAGGKSHPAFTALWLILWLFSPGSVRAETITIQNRETGVTPEVLGYNLGHFMVDSNTADWWRYSGVKATRVFISGSDIESSDDIDGIGDGVNSLATFNSRRAALRANAANAGEALDNSYINWSVFTAGYAKVASGNNRYSISGTFPILRSLDVEILANITASPGRFPIASATDWPNIWELWQHYYAQAFHLSKNYDVRRFGMFNEPNGWSPAISVEDWHLRLQICSDAIRAGVADANARYGKNLVSEVFAPNTANGSNKYDDPVDYWGKHAVTNRHLKFDGTTDLNWWNFDNYNYQQYTMSTSTYASHVDTLRSKITADMPGETPFPLSLTEYNVSTAANYDSSRETLDTPSNFVALAANSIVLAERGANQLYLFKFSQTARTTGYGVVKNASHYVNNASSGKNNIGGITKGGEAYRLFCKAAGNGRNCHAFTSDAGSNVWVMATRDPATNVHYVYIANKNASAVSLDVSVSELGVIDGSFVKVEEVSGNGGLGGGADQKATAGHGGAVSRYTTIAGGKVPAANIPGESVWLVSIYAGVQGSPQIIEASADTVLRDGAAKNTTGGSATQLSVRSDGTADNRRVTLFKFPLPEFQATDLKNVLLTFSAGTLGTNNPVQVHVYGLNDDSWVENTSTWATLTSALKQNVADGNQIDNNIVANQGTTTKILGQVWVNSTTISERAIDVTDFVREQTDGTVSFLVVQDHRWDNTLDSTTNQTVGDTQLDGMKIASREDGVKAGPRLRLFTRNTVDNSSSYYWDSNDGTDGFGNVNGTWSSTTAGTTTGGWTTDATGSTTVNANSVTTGLSDTVKFGTSVNAYGTATKTISVSGTVNVGTIVFGNTSIRTELSGGTINFGDTGTITSYTTVGSGAGATIMSAITGAGTSLIINGGAGTATTNVIYYTGILDGSRTINIATNTRWDQSATQTTGEDLTYQVDGYFGIRDLVADSTRTFMEIGELRGAGTVSRASSANDGVGIIVGGKNTDSLFSGVIAALNTSLEKVGSGTLTLSGTNTYTDATTISGGTLALSGSGSIDASSSVAIKAGATFDTSAKTNYTIPNGKPLTFFIDPAGSGSCGKITAAGLNVSSATVSYDITGTLDDPVYVLATYAGTLQGTFLSAPSVPTDYTLQYAYQGNKIALVRKVYELWASANELSGDDFSVYADPDNDGFVNLLEFAFGMDPNNPARRNLVFTPDGDVTQSGAPVLMNFAAQGQTPDFRAVFCRRKDHEAAGLSYTVEFSANLSYWESSNTAPTVITGVDSAGELEAVSVPYPATVPIEEGGAEQQPQFFRVGVSAN